MLGLMPGSKLGCAFCLAAALGALGACGPKSSGGGGGAEEPGGGGGETMKSDAQMTTDLLGALRTEVECPGTTSPHRIWCVPADGWATAAVVDVPDGSVLLVGLTLSLPDGEPVDDWLENGVHVSALGLRSEGGKHLARIAPLVEENEQTAAMMREVAADLTKVFKGEATEVTLPKELATYLADLPAAADYELTRGERGWSWQGASATELRKVGDHWVSIEIPPKGERGILVSLFTTKVTTKLK